ncbi:NCL2 [Scenedesmus sp. PABB004]|nr:NCL2 [Scenedesmus sp. PABB004]
MQGLRQPPPAARLSAGSPWCRSSLLRPAHRAAPAMPAADALPRVGAARRRGGPAAAAADGLAAGGAAQPSQPSQPPAPAQPPPAPTAVYLRGPLAPGAVVEQPGSSVVLLGDLPAGARVVAGGDVIVLGTLAGAAEAGCGGDGASLVLASAVAPDAALSIAGRPAPPPSSAGRATGVMLRLGPGASQPAYEAMPGTPPLPVAGGAAEAPGAKLVRAAGALGVLALGIALVLAPASVLGGLLSTDAESVAGALLDVFVFGYILLSGAKLLSDGSELLLEIVSPGIIGGVVLPVLGALPDSLIILTSLNAPAAEAASTVAVGVGTLAGSTVLLLSLAWGASVLVGRCDLGPDGIAIDKRLTRGWDLFATGVTVDQDVRTGAAIMSASVLLYGIVQGPAALGFSRSPQAALAGAVTCLACMVAYCGYSVLFPALQARRIEAARKARFRSVAVKALAVRSSERYGGPLVDPAGALNPAAVRSIFEEFDADRSGAIDARELQGLLVGLQLGGGQADGLLPDEESLEYVLKEFDRDADARISYDEFSAALGRWTAAALEGEAPDEAAEDLEAGGGEGAPLSSRDILLRSVVQMGAGIALCAVFSDPLVDALSNLSRASGVPPFFVGFVLTPLASNSSELVSSLAFAARKRRRTLSLTLSQVYGAVTINNTMCLGLFLVVVYLRDLPWVYSSEVTVIVACTLAVGWLGWSRSSFQSGWALPVMALYPLALGGAPTGVRAGAQAPGLVLLATRRELLRLVLRFLVIVTAASAATAAAWVWLLWAPHAALVSRVLDPSSLLARAVVLVVLLAEAALPVALIYQRRLERLQRGLFDATLALQGVTAVAPLHPDDAAALRTELARRDAEAAAAAAAAAAAGPAARAARAAAAFAARLLLGGPGPGEGVLARKARDLATLGVSLCLPVLLPVLLLRDSSAEGARLLAPYLERKGAASDAAQHVLGARRGAEQRAFGLTAACLGSVPLLSWALACSNSVGAGLYAAELERKHPSARRGLPGAMSGRDAIILDDVFEVIQKDPDGKKFDRVSRFVCRSELYEFDLALDINIDIYPLKVGDKFNLVLATTIHRDGTPETGKYDENFPTLSKRETLMDEFEYVMHGLVYKYSSSGGGGGGGALRVEVYVSFGGLLMKLKGDPAKLSVLTVDSKTYLLMRRV